MAIMNGISVTKPNEFLPTRQSLLCRLKNSDDQESWREFFELYWKLIYSTALKAGLTEDEAQEVVQETVISVAKQMPEFRYDPSRGSFKNWLMKLTVWRITDQLRRRLPVPTPRPQPADRNPQTATIDRIPDPHGFDPAADWDNQWEKNLMEAAVSRVKCKVDAKQFQIFDLYVFRQWSIAQIVQTLDVSAASIYMAKYRITRLIRKEIKHLELEMELGQKPSRAA